MSRIRRLFRSEQASGILMIAAMLMALAAANSPLAPIYWIVHDIPVHFRFGPLILDEPLVRWINEGLLVFFFLLVGLEIKRQFLEGHLSTVKSAALPAFAAFGGMVVPAVIFLSFNAGDPIALKGWAIPTTTDIVLALGVLSLLGARVPVSLKVFLAALAIFDDIGAILIIGIFYGESISLLALAFAVVGMAALVILNAYGKYSVPFYTLIGLFLWISLLEAGIEASLTGFLIALTVPLRRGHSSPLREAERHLHPWCVLVVVPLFAFFNSGISIGNDTPALLLNPVSFGIVGGLLFGKQIGVIGASCIAVWIGLAQLPKGVNWAHLYGVALLAGIGFTMSLFIASLAFSDPVLVKAAKSAIIIGSSLSAMIGLAVIYATTRSRDTSVVQTNVP